MSTLKVKFLREYFFSHPSRIFSLPSFLKNLFPPTHGLSRNPTMTAFNLNRFVDSVCGLDTILLRIDRRASGNKGLAKVAVQWLIEHLYFVSSAVLADSFVLPNRQLLKPAFQDKKRVFYQLFLSSI